MPRGGERSGKVGQVYGNRTDMNQPKVPTIVPKGAAYGQRQALEMSQQQLPPAAGNPGQPAPVGAPAVPSAPVGAAPAPGGPMALPPLNRPSDRPGEPTTHGLSTGPGAGPEALQMPPNNLANLLAQLANAPFASPAVKALAAQARMGRQ